MKLTRMVITLSRTLNTGNYSSAKAEYTEEVVIDEETDSRIECREQLLNRCELGLRKALEQTLTVK